MTPSKGLLFRSIQGWTIPHPMSDEITKIKHWAELLKATRRFFDTRGFYEVITPALVPAGAFEASLDPISAQFSLGKAQLHTSPEFEMKWLLSQTRLPIYQVCKVFRDDPPTGIHKR